MDMSGVQYRLGTCSDKPETLRALRDYLERLVSVERPLSEVTEIAVEKFNSLKPPPRNLAFAPA